VDSCHFEALFWQEIANGNGKTLAKKRACQLAETPPDIATPSKYARTPWYQWIERNVMPLFLLY